MAQKKFVHYVSGVPQRIIHRRQRRTVGRVGNLGDQHRGGIPWKAKSALYPGNTSNPRITRKRDAESDQEPV